MGGFAWRQDELALLRSMYPHLYADDVAALLGRSTKSVHQRARAMGVGKSAEFERAHRQLQHLRAVHNEGVRRAQFKPGQAPWNKGKAGSTGLHPNCRKGWFGPRAPHEAHNWLPIGTLRIGRDGQLERKVSDDRSRPPARRWVSVARLVWEAAHGPVPPGHIVVFRDPRQRTTDEAGITPDLLACITLAQNMRRNSLAERAPELHRLVQLKGCITRQANRITREAAAR